MYLISTSMVLYGSMGCVSSVVFGYNVMRCYNYKV